MNICEDYVKHGLALVPIQLGKKKPTLPGWNLPENAVTTTDAAANMTGNVGLLHAYCSHPTACVDIDDLTTATTLLEAEGINIDLLIRAKDSVLISSGRPNRAKLLYRLPENIPPLKMIQIENPASDSMIFELRSASSNGKSVQDILPPSRHPTGTDYEWAGNGHWSKLPELPPEILDYWKRQLEQREKSNLTTPIGNVSDASVTLPPETIQHLRSALLHMRSDTRSHWVKIGMALYQLGETGRGLWLEWSETSKKYDAADAAKKWDSFNPTSIGYKFVFSEAQRQGWINPTKNYTDTTDIFTQTTSAPCHQSNTPQQLLETLKPVPALNPDDLPDTLKGAAVDISERLQCPIDYIVVAMLSAAGTIIGNKVGIYPLANDESWEVFPCLWGGIVGPPGSKKTPALFAALAPLNKLEAAARDRFKAAYAEYKADYEQYKRHLLDWKKKTSKTLPVEPEEPKPERYIVNDVTYQKLGEILADNPRGVLALSDELSGLLQSLDTPGQEAARGFYLTGWGGNSGYCFDRVTRGTIVLSRYCLSVFGGFQPDKIKAYVQYAQSGNSKNDGLLQRFQLLVWPDLMCTTGIIDRTPNKIAMDAYDNAMQNLELVANRFAAINNGKHGKEMLHFEPDAQKLFLDWYQVLETMLAKSSLDSARQSHFAKYRSLIPALALIFHLLDGNNDAVQISSLSKAIHFATYLKGHANRIYSSVSGADHTNTNTLARKLLNGDLNDGFTCRTVYLKGWSGLSNKEAVQVALDSLVEYSWLTEEEIRSGGRPTVAYRINAGISEELLND
jgi:hypothetical protein